MAWIQGGGLVVFYTQAAPVVRARASSENHGRRSWLRIRLLLRQLREVVTVDKQDDGADDGGPHVKGWREASGGWWLAGWARAAGVLRSKRAETGWPASGPRMAVARAYGKWDPHVGTISPQIGPPAAEEKSLGGLNGQRSAQSMHSAIFHFLFPIFFPLLPYSTLNSDLIQILCQSILKSYCEMRNTNFRCIITLFIFLYYSSTHF
jgi:hypothetical protein